MKEPFVRSATVAATGDMPIVTADLGENGRIKALLLLAVLVGLGIGVEWLFRKVTQRARSHLDALPSETVKERLHIVALRFATVERGFWPDVFGRGAERARH